MAKHPTGLLYVGVFVAVEQMFYGKNHATRAGERIDGFFRIDVLLFPGQRFPQGAAFAEVDGSTGIPSPIFDQVDQQGIVPGDVVAIHVAVDSVGKYGPQLRALGIVKLDGEVLDAEGPATAAAPWPSTA
jgi:hypothetical protein